MLFLEGALSEGKLGNTKFTRIKAPTLDDIIPLMHTISRRMARYLEKAGLKLSALILALEVSVACG